jgi:hypothetical protein
MRRLLSFPGRKAPAFCVAEGRQFCRRSSREHHHSRLLASFASHSRHLGRLAAEPGEILPERRAYYEPGTSPSDAIVQFDGKICPNGSQKDGGPARWTIADGVATVNGSGGIATKEGFGTPLHIEWAHLPWSKYRSKRQQQRLSFRPYEVQVLDSYENKTYYHGQAGAIYKQHAPLVTACRKPASGNPTISFTTPPASTRTQVTKAATHGLQNGILVQDNVEILPTGPPPKIRSAPVQTTAGPKTTNPVRYRNI